MSEPFNNGDAVAAWLNMSLEDLRLALGFFHEKGLLKRHRLGGTLQYCLAAGMTDRAKVLAVFLDKIDHEAEVSAAQCH